MKKNFIVYTFIIFVLTSLTIFAEREVDFEKLEYNEETKLVYVEGEKETFTGIAKYYSKDESSIFEFPYKNGKKEGRGKEYYLNGKFKSDAFFIDGLLQGKSIGYYENGNLEYEENYKDGKLDGLVKNYYENGQLKAELNYKNGQLDGLARAYHENGQLHIEENYKDGKLEGESTNYDENGNLTSKAIYKDDEMVENLFGDTEEDTSSKNNKLKGYTGPIILCGLIGLYVFLTAFKMFKSFPKTSHLTDEQRSRIFKILMKHDEGNKELFSSYTLNGVGSSYYRVASMMVDNEKVYIYAKMLSFVYLPTPITFGYLFGYSKDHILASYSNATFKEVKKEIEETVLHM
ncbi:toxin-antitoxin system YwqK family antitoxin [Fusobacterium periodonticum]|uniref:MORN repeat protein n=1 Tax=Fusobacterium periodonticum ATCC 33693 TaxID=546275 RepID=D4CVA8_9FUSO|nr:toxin-antitoxin system YwqK family antitoxin [Fusobacterium periodonticum]EFE86737.1 MORN repeat protein [Fusobacterium periodonticum ATCC 33693]